ncbi:hypothetical protein GGR57DRAFT_372946 [Xylariaceae sp. FL1272]|nr:hypothetical protein GGR57DRAFT_372946 [Xylariaceae sp. FL1272]
MKRKAQAPAECEAFIDLRHHSLNAVVGHNKSLWLRPQQWTWAHLRALCIDYHADADADADADAATDGTATPRCDIERPEETTPKPTSKLVLHAYIPVLESDNLSRRIGTLTRREHSSSKVMALFTMLVFRPSSLRKTLCEWTREAEENNIEAGPFTFSLSGAWPLGLAVGSRTYKLPMPSNFLLGPSLVLPYMDSYHLDAPYRFPDGYCQYNTPYEPCLAAVLIALAQREQAIGAVKNESVVITRLIFSIGNDDQYIHLYTARVSRLLLERFRHPNRARALTRKRRRVAYGDYEAATDALVEMRHERIAYRPLHDFRHRLLAAVAVQAHTTTTPMPTQDQKYCHGQSSRNISLGGMGGGDDQDDDHDVDNAATPKSPTQSTSPFQPLAVQLDIDRANA